MKEYWHIPGPKDSPRGRACIAFTKYDGNNIRVEWSRKQGWYKFGTRNRRMDGTDEDFGQAIPLFLDKYGDPLARTIVGCKDFRGVQYGVIVYCELHGPNSFAGIHHPDDELTVTLFDVNINKRGFVLPRDFLRIFGHLDVPPVVYEGNFNDQFIFDVRRGLYPVKEGVVAKGVLPGGNPQHKLWMAKVKTRAWLDELKQRASKDEKRYGDALKANLREQEGVVV